MGNLDNTEHALSRKCNSNLFLAACSEVPSPNWLHSASPSWVPQGHLQSDGAVLVSELINCTHTYSMSGTGIQEIFACICTTLSHLQRDSIVSLKELIHMYLTLCGPSQRLQWYQNFDENALLYMYIYAYYIIPAPTNTLCTIIAQSW